jgi:hypothetical protein
MTKDFFASRKPSVVLPFIVFPSNRWQLNLSPPVHTCVASFSLTSQHHAHWSFHPTSFARYFIAGNLCELVGTGWYFSLFWTTPTPNLRATYHPRRWIHLDARLLGPGTMTSVITTGYPVLGFSPPRSDIYGLQAGGDGVMAATSFMKDFGGRLSGFTAESIMASATSAHQTLPIRN